MSEHEEDLMLRLAQGNKELRRQNALLLTALKNMVAPLPDTSDECLQEFEDTWQAAQTVIAEVDGVTA